jgi:hypothetical protein
MENKKDRTGTDKSRSNFNVATDYIRNTMASTSGGALGKGLEMGVGAVLAKTVLRRLPPPLNLFAPTIAEKVIMKYGVSSSREVLLRGLKWVKRATDEKPEPTDPNSSTFKQGA